RGWLLNKYSRAEFSVGYDATRPQSAQKFSEKNFQFGNLVQIEHLPSTDWTLAKRGKLPDWTGIILPNRDWDLGVGHVTAYSAEAILSFRAMQHRSVQGTPKTVFMEIMEIVHSRAKNIVIQPGQLDDSPITYPNELQLNGYDEIIDLVNNCGMDWDVTGQIDEKNNLQLFYNLYNRKGVDTSLILSSSNTELQGPLLSEQGTPTNQVFGYSEASTKESRFGPLEGIDQAAVDDYGPLQLNQIFSGKHDPASVQRAAQVKAEARGRPIKIIKRIALDRAKTFDFLNVGNTATVKETRVGFHPNGGYGFESQVKILSMDYNDLSNKVVLNIEVQ
ncbi:MAG TPA: hypothetical protein VFU31_27800, partial [Candidatus Binatia bacterium]|nr:hypothetical protein [Candidatus Binatia bacterium]